MALLTIGNPEERGFYEIETVANGWSVRELERQIAASLYERLALSRDKSEVRRLSSEGQVVEKASDLVKNPLVLEFLDLAGCGKTLLSTQGRKLSDDKRRPIACSERIIRIGLSHAECRRDS